MAVSAQHIGAHVANRQLFREALLAYPLEFLPLLGGGCAAVIILIVDVDTDEAPVERIDDAAVGERTRSQPKGGTSAPSRVDLAFHGQEKDRPVFRANNSLLLRHREGAQQPVRSGAVLAVDSSTILLRHLRLVGSGTGGHMATASTSRTAAMVKQRPTETAWVTWSRSGSGSGLVVLVTMVSGIHPSRVRVETMQTRRW